MPRPISRLPAPSKTDLEILAVLWDSRPPLAERFTMGSWTLGDSGAGLRTRQSRPTWIAWSSWIAWSRRATSPGTP
jgi:hypothetical protein